MQNTSRLETTGLNLELFHVQTNTSFELATNLAVIHIGKPKEKFNPDINVSVLPDTDFVSRRHAEIHVDKGNYYLVDVGSTNGTYLNNIRLNPQERYSLSLGDKIDLGHGNRVTFIFLHKQNVVHQTDTILNNPGTVIQIEFLGGQTKKAPMDGRSKPVGLVAMAVGVLVLIVNIQSGVVILIPSILLCLGGVVVLTWRNVYRILGWVSIALGIAVMLLIGNAFSSVSFFVILVSCALLVAGYQLFSTGKILNIVCDRTRN
ncbi:FHA domain-containing protein [Aetokthonos hydrillicola Thurmond2011]|jgi:pSer/pThr/pTyr-binding forkhead associated (FHA) protein|uniref:FHA domain-containing protein n=1 Tax=Aetokthonos hydrillicola Thurmond2011 TaxID=2712845 RepID=A0AAP5I4K6_9CYAN|nr:FHA domain-containing protein [Aetokthonos hydrillicola]MBO3457630.1 FHA domain-containing protein [Aetokthonos hydrillicola CCALA 1050]MBW4587909.1 FHA domain-containing protein [Aetokthonos hydrillicola CCALA 1050]MDR9894686.1 FHA domain-containing protein [Aetokthonos hydrillicola Thurmond2011]